MDKNDFPEDDSDYLEDEFLDEEELKKRLRRRKRRYKDLYEYDEGSDIPIHEPYTKEEHFKK
ncbi:MAG: hypothetical protein R6V53_01925 [Candidatus Woesearchaeota archaeon]